MLFKEATITPFRQLPAPTLDQFIRHARLYGVDRVWETARVFLPSDELTQLLTELKGIAAEHRKAKRPETWWEGVPSSYTPDGDPDAELTQPQREVKALRDAGHSPAEIVRKTRKSEKAVSRLLAELRKLESQPVEAL